MYPAKFEYYRANSVQEALQLSQDHSEAKFLAGGHSLIPMMKLRLAQPPALIDIGGISELSGITQSNGRIRIGALTTHSALASSDVLRDQCRVVAEAAAEIADPQVRNKGTVGGNLAHADPGSDLPAVVLALGATIHLTGPNGDRQVNAADFFLDLLTTDIKTEEILTAIEVGALGESTGSCYLKFEHPASGYAVCGAAAVVKLAADGTCESCQLCFNGVTATPYSAGSVSDALAGKNPDDATIAQLLSEQLSIDEPMGDTYASGPYRVEVAKVYGRNALRTARDRAQS
jgi:carbon-monoxide dehydrogenase medium subunit